jgi:hypothetical protein
MIGQLLPNTNEMLQCILVHQSLDLNTARVVNRISNEWSSILVFEASEDFISDASLVPAEEDELETQLNFSSHFSIGP